MISPFFHDLSFFVVLLPGLVLHAPALTEERLSVVELFTSQGCSSCPPADELLHELSQQENILALSFNIDYWNYLGWKDSFAKPEFSARQREYNRSLGRRNVYTPQMIINGREAVVGSRKEQVYRTLEDADLKPAARPRITLNHQKNLIHLTIAAGETRRPATIWLIAYDIDETVDIKGGELAGQTRHYRNVVRALKPLGSWTGQETRLTFDPLTTVGGLCDRLAVLVQAQKTGPILSAAQIDFKASVYNNNPE